MWNFASSLFQKVVHFSPIKTIFQQLFQKFSKDFLEIQPQLSFKDGVLELDKLQLSSSKINQTFLTGSPYVLHYGVINNIRINLPANESKGTNNIQIKVDGIQLVMEPNQHFKETFQQNINNIKQTTLNIRNEGLALQQPTVSQTNNSFSFFKRMLQQFFTNMKVDILNISIKWFMSKPSKNVEQKPQYYLMLRVPRIAAQRVNDKQVGKIHEDFMKYRIQIPQISIHILKENLKAPQFSNFKARMADIPDFYPPVTHPSTILLMGRQEDIGEQRISIVVRISKNIKNKSKQLSINVEEFPNLEVMIEPVQLVVLTKFLEQIQAFKRVYNSVIEKAKAESGPFNRAMDQSRDFDISHDTESERMSFRNVDVNKSMDIFSSFAVSIQQFGGKVARPPSYLATIFENNKEIDAEIVKLSKQMEKQSKPEEVIEHEQFKSITILKLNLKMIRIFILKYESSSELFQYERVWAIDQCHTNSLINTCIPSSYFMIALNDLTVSFETNSSTAVKFKELSILDVQLKTTINIPKKESVNKKIEASSINQSIDVFQSCTGIPLEESQLKELLRFSINQEHSHYCCTTIFSISHRPTVTKTFRTSAYAHTNFYDPFRNLVSKDKQFGFVLTLQKEEKSKINCNIYSVSLFIDDNVIHDMLMVFRPLFTYKSLIASKTDLSCCDAEGEIKNNKILNHSIYDFHEQVGHEAMSSLRGRSSTSQSQHNKKSTKPEINLQIEQIHVILQPFKNVPPNLIHHYTTCIYDSELFDHRCYCQKHVQGIDLTIQDINYKKCMNTKLNLMDLSLRMVNEEKGQISIEDLLHLGKQSRSYPKISIETITTQTIIKKEVLTIRLPKFGVVIQKDTPKLLLGLVESWKEKGDQFKQLNKYCKEEISKYSNRPIAHPKMSPKVSKATRVFNVYVERLGLQFLSYELLVKHVLVKFQDNLLIAKIFEGVLAKTNQPILKLQNPWKSNDFMYYKDDSHQQKFKKYGLRSGIDRIVAYIEKTMEFPLQGQLKQKEYFQVLFKLPVPVEVNLLFQNQKYKPNEEKICKAPNFSKSSKNQPKLRSKVIDVVIRVPIFIKGIEIMDFKYVKAYFDQARNSFKQSPILNPPNKPRRPSQDLSIPPQTMEQKMIVKVTAETIHVDVFPYVESTKEEETVSHTRSMIQVHDLQVLFNQKQTIDCNHKVEKLKVKWKQISLYFLIFFDAYLDLNKEMIPFAEIDSYGFRRMMDLKGDFEMIETKTRQLGKQVEVSANIYELDATFSSHSIGFIDDHVKHILKNLKDALSKLKTNNHQSEQNENQREDSEESAEDFDDIDQKLQQFENNKLRQESEFRSDPIQLVERQNKEALILRFNLKQVDLRRICIKITDQPDYQFINYVPRGQNVPIMIELDQKLELSEDLFIQKHEINKFKRFRGRQKMQGKILKILLQNTVIYLQKYEDKLNLKSLNLSLVVNLKALQCNLYVPDNEETFPILRTIDRFQILVDVQDTKTKVKTAGKRIELGFSSALNYLKKDIKATNQKRKQSMFCIEEEKKVEESNGTLTTLMLYIPQMSVTLNLQLIGWKFISNQHLNVPSLFFHNTLSKYMEEDNKEFVKQWIKSILTDNLGKLLGNGFTNLVCNSLLGILMCLKQIVMLPSHAIGIFKSSN